MRGPRSSSKGLVIPKVDPKVAEQPEQRKATPGELKKKPVTQSFEQRRRDAQKAPEEKVFGRRGVGKRSSERRSLVSKLVIDGSITIKELAHEMGVTASEVIKKLFLGFGLTATINQELDPDTAVLVAGEFGTEVELKAADLSQTLEVIDDPDEDKELRKPRPPVVVVMGHVDHGKTTLLDAIRESRVAAGEAGGITQHIGAYVAEVKGKKITFLDTPGHEAFAAMRARGAKVTDIAILVVAADDGVMPQTVEAINHARASNVPIVVAINKIDKESANANRVLQELAQHGVVVEEWGGDTISVPVSAKLRTNLDQLLEMILLVSEVQDLKANASKEARGTILEAQLDKSRGPVATVLVQAGTLQVGDIFVAGGAWGKVRAMFDDRGRKLKKAGPSAPVQVMGFASVPEAGDVFRALSDEKQAREIAEKRASHRRQEDQQTTKVTNLEDLMAKVKEGELRDLNLIIKGDVQGSVEALKGALVKLHNEEAQVHVVHSAVGAISESDVMLAATSKAIIIGFNVRPDDRAQKAAAQENVDLRTYRVIYETVDDMKAALQGMLSPKFQEVILGKAEVREVFRTSKVGVIAGCMVQDGTMSRNAKVRLIRDSVVVWQGAMGSLRRFKDDVREVGTGLECGILLENFSDIKEKDIIEAYQIQEIRLGA